MELLQLLFNSFKPPAALNFHRWNIFCHAHLTYIYFVPIENFNYHTGHSVLTNTVRLTVATVWSNKVFFRVFNVHLSTRVYFFAICWTTISLIFFLTETWQQPDGFAQLNRVFLLGLLHLSPALMMRGGKYCLTLCLGTDLLYKSVGLPPLHLLLNFLSMLIQFVLYPLMLLCWVIFIYIFDLAYFFTLVSFFNIVQHLTFPYLTISWGLIMSV